MFKLDNLSQRDRRAVIFGVAALLAVVVVRWGVVPFIGSWQQAREEAAVNAQHLSSLEDQLRSLLGQRQRLEDMYGSGVRKPLEGLEAATLKFNQAVQTVVRESGIREAKYTPQSPKPLPELRGVQTIGMRVAGQCQLPQLTKCLSDLRKADSLIIVDSFTVSSDESKPGNLDVTFVLATLTSQ